VNDEETTSARTSGREDIVRIEQPGRSSPGAGRGASTGASANGELTTADLIKGIADDATTLVKQEILLARQELTEGLAKVAKASALLIVAGVLLLYALGLLFETMAWGLEALGLPKSASFGIVTLLLLIVAGILGLIGQRRLAKTKVAPERAQAELRETTADLSEHAKVAAAEVRADLSGSVRTVKEEAAAAPTKVKDQVKDQVTSLGSRVQRGKDDE
jgi:hypothetical protein